MTNGSDERWVLAFDSSCGSCRRLSRRIKDACAGRLESVPLADPEVVAWRQSALGADPAFVPTLLRVTPRSVRAWTGRAMIMPLVRHLGPVASLRVTYALGSLRDEIAADRHGAAGMSRKRFLQLGAGVVIGGTLVLRNELPAFAADPVDAWVRAHAGRLPGTYDDIVALPEDYRRRVYWALSPETRSALWSEQFARYRSTHPTLTAEQAAVLDHAAATVTTPRALLAVRSAPDAADEDFRRRAGRAFGDAEAAALFASLGPSDVRSAATPQCSCSSVSDWCAGVISCRNRSCRPIPYGCGTGYVYPCNGLCDS